jgi:hypothetical protein
MKSRVDFYSMLVFAFVLMVVLPSLLPEQGPVSSASFLSVQTPPPSDNPNLPPTPQAETRPLLPQPASSSVHWGSFIGGLSLGAVLGFIVAQFRTGETRVSHRTDRDRAA